MKLIFVTGGVISGLGKGVTASSIGRLMKSCGYTVTMMKADPYLQVDAGTMSPYEHGEVFVTHDGMETDLDVGNYERFIDVDLDGTANPTTGKIYLSVIQKERRGDYLGKTVQVVPHITNEIKERILTHCKGYDIGIIEIGGQPGDAESPHFIEAIRQLRKDVGKTNVCYIHIVPLLYFAHLGEHKTKPIQNSVRELRQGGISPDVLVCRTSDGMPENIRGKIALFADIDEEDVIEAPNAKTIYQVPLMLAGQGMHRRIEKVLNLKKKEPNLKTWTQFVNNILEPKHEVHIGIIGKYAEIEDAYASVNEALIHAGAKHKAKVHRHWIHSELIEKDPKYLTNFKKKTGLDGIIIPGAFGKRGTEGKILAIKYAREKNIPYLGICIGLQLAVIEFARHVCKIKDACSTELSDDGTPCIDYLPDQSDTTEKGGTMRLGNYEAVLEKGSLAYELYGKKRHATERHRHRYEVVPTMHETLESHSMKISGKSHDGRLAEYIELPDHPYFIATQAHPEFTSRPNRPNPLFDGLIKAALKK